MPMLHPLEAPFAEQRTEVPLAYPTHEARVALTQIFIYIGSRHQLRCLPLARLAEVLAAMLLHGWYVAVGTVAQLDVHDLLGGEVMALATVQQVHTLRIELFVLDGRVHIDHLRQLHAEEAAAARGVGEQKLSASALPSHKSCEELVRLDSHEITNVTGCIFCSSTTLSNSSVSIR